MLTAVAQTLAEILVGGSSLSGTEQIDFNHPCRLQPKSSTLNLYCYDIRENQQMSPLKQSNQGLENAQDPCTWFDISFLLTAWDSTALGEQHLLSEALTLLLDHRFLPEAQLAPALRGLGTLPLKVSAIDRFEAAAFWTALGIPLRPALSVTVTVPFYRLQASHASQRTFYKPSN